MERKEVRINSAALDWKWRYQCELIFFNQFWRDTKTGINMCVSIS